MCDAYRNNFIRLLKCALKNSGIWDLKVVSHEKPYFNFNVHFILILYRKFKIEYWIQINVNNRKHKNVFIVFIPHCGFNSQSFNLSVQKNRFHSVWIWLVFILFPLETWHQSRNEIIQKPCWWKPKVVVKKD